MDCVCGLPRMLIFDANGPDRHHIQYLVGKKKVGLIIIIKPIIKPLTTNFLPMRYQKIN